MGERETPWIAHGSDRARPLQTNKLNFMARVKDSTKSKKRVVEESEAEDEAECTHLAQHTPGTRSSQSTSNQLTPALLLLRYIDEVEKIKKHKRDKVSPVRCCLLSPRLSAPTRRID
jgi:hypothetical protein